MITIHGVNADNWQDDVAAALAPHFECEPFRYPEFQSVLGAMSAPLRKIAARRAARNFRDFFEEVYDDTSRPPPHLIAHSFGTVLTGMILPRQEVRFSQIIFVGSALHRGYPWHGLRAPNAEKFQDVRNETGDSDAVLRYFASVGSLLSCRLGIGGLLGFNGPGTHTVAGPWERCDECAQEPAFVHNVPLGEYAHSDVFLSARHARELWLPVLWGFAPSEYREFVNVCRKAVVFDAEGAALEAEIAEKELHDWLFHFDGVHAPPLRFIEYARLQLRAYMKRNHPDYQCSDEQWSLWAALVVRGVCTAVVDALAAGSASEEARNRAAAMRPRTAAIRAVVQLARQIILTKA